MLNIFCGRVESHSLRNPTHRSMLQTAAYPLLLRELRLGARYVCSRSSLVVPLPCKIIHALVIVDRDVLEDTVLLLPSQVRLEDAVLLLPS